MGDLDPDAANTTAPLLVLLLLFVVAVAVRRFLHEPPAFGVDFGDDRFGQRVLLAILEGRIDAVMFGDLATEANVPHVFVGGRAPSFEYIVRREAGHDALLVRLDRGDKGVRLDEMRDGGLAC